MLLILSGIIVLSAMADASLFLGRGYRNSEGVPYVKIFDQVFKAEESSTQKIYQNERCYLCNIKAPGSGRLPRYTCQGPSPSSTNGKIKYISPC